MQTRMQAHQKGARKGAAFFRLTLSSADCLDAWWHGLGQAHMLRAITIFITSFEPPKMRVTRLSR